MCASEYIKLDSWWSKQALNIWSKYSSWDKIYLLDHIVSLCSVGGYCVISNDLPTVSAMAYEENTAILYCLSLIDLFLWYWTTVVYNCLLPDSFLVKVMFFLQCRQVYHEGIVSAGPSIKFGNPDINFITVGSFIFVDLLLIFSLFFF